MKKSEKEALAVAKKAAAEKAASKEFKAAKKSKSETDFIGKQWAFGSDSQKIFDCCIAFGVASKKYPKGREFTEAIIRTKAEKLFTGGVLKLKTEKRLAQKVKSVIKAAATRTLIAYDSKSKTYTLTPLAVTGQPSASETKK